MVSLKYMTTACQSLTTIMQSRIDNVGFLGGFSEIHGNVMSIIDYNHVY